MPVDIFSTIARRKNISILRTSVQSSSFSLLCIANDNLKVELLTVFATARGFFDGLLGRHISLLTELKGFL